MSKGAKLVNLGRSGGKFDNFILEGFSRRITRPTLLDPNLTYPNFLL